MENNDCVVRFVLSPPAGVGENYHVGKQDSHASFDEQNQRRPNERKVFAGHGIGGDWTSESSRMAGGLPSNSPKSHKMVVALLHLPAPFLSDEKTLMPMGLLYVAASLEMHGHRAAIIDLAGRSDYQDCAIRGLQKLAPDLSMVGLGMTSSQSRIGIELAGLIRSHFPDTLLVAGGPHVTHGFQASSRQPERTRAMLEHLRAYFDCLILGDAELAILAAAESRRPKVIDATSPRSPYFVDSTVMEALPYPARHLLDYRAYHYNLGHSEIRENKAVSIISQRGCPYACRFCAGRMDSFARTIRRVSTAKIIAEIEYLFETYGYTDFTFYDDELNVNPQLGGLLTSLIELQMRLGRQFRFRCFLRSNATTLKQIRHLAGAGFKVVAIGAESGSSKILKNMMKKATKEQNTRVLEWASDFGILTKTIISLGHPGESEQTLRETEAWLDEVQPGDLNFTIVSALPSSAYFDEAVLCKGVWTYTCPESGDRLYDRGVNWDEEVHFFHGDPAGHYRPTVYTDYLSSDDLVHWHRCFEQKYRSVRKGDISARSDGRGECQSSPCSQLTHRSGALLP